MPGSDELDPADWDAAAFRPLAEEDALLAERLSAIFATRFDAELLDGEKDYVNGWPAVQIDVAVTTAGTRVLRVAIPGHTDLVEWDGSEADAIASVESSARARAGDASTDYWM